MKISHKRLSVARFDGWNFGEDVTDAAVKPLRRELRLAVEMALEQQFIYFAETCGAVAKNPLTIHVEFHSQNSTHPEAGFKFTLDEVLRHDIQDCEEDGSYVEELRRIGAALGRLSKRCMTAVERGERADAERESRKTK